MEEGKFTEFADKQVIYYETPKRKHRLKIFVPVGKFPIWKIAYEDGNPVDGLSSGVYLSRLAAKKAVQLWDLKAKKTKEAKQFELFGDKEPPVLKRKKVRSSAARA